MGVGDQNSIDLPIPGNSTNFRNGNVLAGDRASEAPRKALLFLAGVLRGAALSILGQNRLAHLGRRDVRLLGADFRHLLGIGDDSRRLFHAKKRWNRFRCRQCHPWRFWKGIHFQQGLFFSKTALVTIGGAYAVLPYVAQMAEEHYGCLGERQMMAGLGLAETTPDPLIMVLQFVGFIAAWQHPGDLPPLLAVTFGATIMTRVTFLPCFFFVFLGAPHVEGLHERPALASTLTAITAALVGVIPNLAVWFTWHAVAPEQGNLDVFVAVVAIGAWVSMERFKVGVIPVLAACGGLGILWKWFM